MRKTLSFATALAAGLLAACETPVGTFNLQLVSADCNGADSFSLIDEASDLVITVTGPEMDSVEVKAATSAGTADLGNIPVGVDRVVTVSALNLSELVAFGRSAPFEVKASGTPEVLVALRPVNRFSPSADPANSCTKMVYPRAGHSAALLPDGRILLAGGFRELDPNGDGLGYLSSTELFDPATGTFTEGPDMCGANHVCIPRAFAPAVTMADGRVMLAGGESQPDETAPRQALASAAIYDPGQAGWTLTTAMKTARRFNTATLLPQRGHVVVVGGLSSEGGVLLSSEFYDPSAGSFRDAATLSARPPATAGGRAYHSAAAVGSQAVALLGGIDADKQSTKQILYLQWSGTSESYDLSTQSEELTSAIFGAGVALLGDLYTVVGGSQQYNDTGFPFSNVFGSAQYTALPSPAPDEAGDTVMKFPRAFPCVAPVDDDRALVVGGFDMSGNATDDAELLTYDAEAGDVNAGFAGGKSTSTSKMARKRAYPTCTRYGVAGEEKILITGGIGADGKATDGAEIYVIKKIAR